MGIEADGTTAKMMADRQGNKECAKLIREYLENNDDREITGTVEDARSVDDLVEFITGGESEKKKKKKKRKSPAQSVTRPDITGHSGGNNRKTGNNGVKKENKDDIKTEPKEDSGKNDTGIKVDTEKQDSKDDSKHVNLK